MLGCNAEFTYTGPISEGFEYDFVAAAINRTHKNITYNGNYYVIPYPNGDIPPHLGVCTDVIIRSYRSIGIDLQKLVHEDIKNNFNSYPISKHWPKQHKPDTNIDHRRVPNLQTFFKRHGGELPITQNENDYKPGDIVTWDIKGSSPWHIGIVTHRKSLTTGNPLIVHNMGRGPVIDDILFSYPITGHYRYVPQKYSNDIMVMLPYMDKKIKI